MRLMLVDSRSLSLVSLCLALMIAVRLPAQNFLQPTVIPTGNWPSAVYTADINNDGNPDLIYVDQGATAAASVTHVLLGDGHGGFKESAQLTTAGTSLAVADMDGDGHIDLVWVAATGPTGPNANNGFTAFIANGRGDGTFAPAVFFNSIALSAQFPQPLSTLRFGHLAAGHFYRPTGPLDLIFQETTQGFLCDFNGPFPAGGCIGITPDSDLQLADLNNDGYLDLIAQQGAIITVALGGPGFYNVPPFKYTFPGSTTVHSFLIKDVDNDGRPDLIVEGANGRIDVFPGNGDGTFANTSIGGTGSLDGLTGNGGHLIAVADLNHDGQLDALTATPAGISTLLGAGTAYLKLGGIYNAGPGHTSYAVADFNGDGNLDLAIDSPEGIAILYGNADGSFQTSRAYAAGQPAMSGALGAFTASGNMDAAVSTSATQARFLRGNGDGTFQPGISTNPDTGPSGLWGVLQAGDFNQDRHQDLAITADGPGALLPTTGSGLSLLYGDGDGTFQPLVHPAAPASPQQQSGSAAPFYGVSAVATVDYGPPSPFDYIFNRDAQTYRIYGGQYPSNFQQILGSQTTTTPHAHNLIVADGHLYNGNELGVFAQQDGHLFEYPGAAYNFNSGPPLGDLSVDGSLTTLGQLTAPDIAPLFPGLSNALGFRAFPGSMLVGHLDATHNGDLLVLYHNLDADPAHPTPAKPNYLYLWYGDTNGRYPVSAAHPVNPVRIQLSRNYYQMAVADLNGDGIPDLILSDGYLLSYQLGLGDGSFGPEHHLLAGQGINSILAGDLRASGRQDLVLANGGAVLTNPVANLDTLATNPDVNTGGVTVLLNNQPKAVTGTLTVSPEPSIFFSAYTITATVSSSQTGKVSFLQDGVVLGPGTLANGTATYTVAAANEYLPGAHILTANITFADLTTATLAGTHIINRAPVIITLMPTTPYTVYYGQGIDGIFTIQVVDGKYPASTTYSLADNGVVVPICNAIPISQSCPYGAPILLDAGLHAFTILYNGDAVNAPGTSPSYPFQVNPDPTTVALSNLPSPSYAGQPVVLTASVAGNFATPVGAVTFSDGGQLNQSATLVNGTATLTVAGLSVGSHFVIATYPGNLDFNPSTSAPGRQVVLPDLTTITLTSSKNPANLGDAISFTVSLTGNFLQPNGAVNLLDGTKLLGSATLVNGKATFTTSTLSVGTHPVTAVYVGNVNFNPATSAVLNELIQPLPGQMLPSTVSLTSNLNPSAPKQLVTFTATVAVPGVFPIVATGSVTFLDGSTVLGTGTLNGVGVAMLQTASLATGSHPITASYAGATGTSGPSILGSGSPVLIQVVTIPLTNSPTGFNLILNPGSLTVQTGGVGTITITVQAISGFNQPVQISCANLPPETSCQFLPSAIAPAGGGIITLKLATSAPRDCDTNQQYGLASSKPSRRSPGSSVPWPVGAPIAIAGLFLLARRRRTSLGKGLLLVAVAASLAAVTGCSHCTDLGTRPGAYRFNVTGIAQGGPITQTQTLSVPLTITLP